MSKNKTITMSMTHEQFKEEIEKRERGFIDTWLLNLSEWVKPYINAGLTLFGMGEVNMSMIVVDDFGNVSRADGLDDSKIEKHEKHIREDDYKPKKYTPILVVPIWIDGKLKLKLINGHHRYHAHLGTNQKRIFVAVGSFNDAVNPIDNKLESAEYWQEDYQLTSNHEENTKFVHNNSTKEDVVASISKTIKREFEEDYSNKKLIEDRILEIAKTRAQRIKHKAKLVPLVFKELKADYDDIRDYTKPQSSEWCRANSKDKHYIIERFTKQSYTDRTKYPFTQYETRMRKHIMKYYDEHKVYPTVYVYLGNVLKRDIDMLRKHIIERLIEQEKFIISEAERMGIFIQKDYVSFASLIKFLPQKKKSEKANKVVEVKYER